MSTPTCVAAEAGAANAILDGAGPTMSVPDVAKIFGISRDCAYRLAVRDELGVRVLRLGRRMRIPTADVRKLLGECVSGDAA